MGVSDRLYFGLYDFDVVFLILFLFGVGWFFFKNILAAWKDNKGGFFDFFKKKKRLIFLWCGLILFSFFEFLYFGYVPMFSMISGKKISHFDFGIASLHGLLLAGYLFFLLYFPCFIL